MNFLGKNDKLLDILINEAYLPNSEIIGIKIYLKDTNLVIEVDVKLSTKREGFIKLSFSGVKEFAFNYMSNHIFYNIETYKLLKQGTLFYISFDPFDNDLSKLSPEDNDVILCESIEGYLYR